MGRRATAAALAVVLAVSLLCIQGCRRRPTARDGISARREVWEQRARAGFTEGRRRAEEFIGDPFREANPGPADPEEPPHLIRPAINTIPQRELSRELPKDFVRIWLMQDDGKTPAAGRRCKLGGEPVAGGPTGWFYPGGPWFVLGNPRDGELTLEITGKGFEDVTRQVQLPPRAEREKGSREIKPDKPSGPDVIVVVGKLQQRYLSIFAFTDSVIADADEPLPVTVRWRGPDLEGTQETQVPLMLQANAYSAEVEVPAGARSASLQPPDPWLPREVEFGPRELTTCADLAGPERFAVTGKVLRPDGSPAPAAEVTITGPRDDRPHQGRCGPDGSYKIRRVPVGKLRIVASAQGYGDSEPVELDYQAQKDVTAPELRLRRSRD